MTDEHLERIRELEAEVKRLTKPFKCDSPDCPNNANVGLCVSCVDALTAERDELKQDVETLRLQLAGCGVAAMQNTESTVKDRITRDNPYYSASYGDVCRAVDREMALRAERDELKKEVEKWKQRLDGALEREKIFVSERDELKKAIREKWNQSSEEAGEWKTYRVCIFCGRHLMIGNRGLLEHPAEVDCIVLHCQPKEGETK